MMEKHQAKDLQCQITGKQINRTTGEHKMIKGSWGGEAGETSFYQSHSLSMQLLPRLSCWRSSNVEFSLHVEMWDYLLALHSVLQRWICKGNNTHLCI